MVLYNEEKHIKKCLDNVNDLVDEIVIVIDKKTTDKTYEICKKYTNKIYFDTADCCEPLRPLCVKHSDGEWLLVLDADETLDNQAKKNIRKIADAFNKNDGFHIDRKEIILGRHLMTVPTLRLYRRNKVHYSCNMHEVPKIKGTIGKLKGYMLHNTEERISQFVGKTNKLTSLEAKELIKKSNLGLFQIFFYALFNSSKFFFGYLFYKKLILKGIPGFIFAFQSGYHEILKYFELKYMRNKKSEERK
jgi:glycosyltransferase involved in cell wall biosynthesis